VRPNWNQCWITVKVKIYPFSLKNAHFTESRNPNSIIKSSEASLTLALKIIGQMSRKMV